MRNLALFLTISAVTFAQTTKPAEQPAPKSSPAIVKVAPRTTAQSGKPAPTVKVSAAPAQKPAAVSVQPVAVKANTTPAAKVSAAAPKAVVAAPKTVVAAPKTVVAAPKVSPYSPVVVPVSAKPSGNAAKVVAVPAKVAPAKLSPAKLSPAKASPAQPASISAAQPKKDGKVQAKQVVVKPALKPQPAPVAVQDSKQAAADKKQEPKSTNANGRRDPFLSPVVNLGAIGSGCSSGKRCLAIDQIALKGIVKADAGMIAVVVNGMDKAYFLRENDPVFNGYVVKITGDSIVFKETFHDKLGKTLTRDITKTISRPVA